MNITKLSFSIFYCLLTALIISAQPGSLDSTFGSGGKVVGNPLSVAETNVAVQADGKIVVAGTVGTNFAVLRYNADGTPDTNFGTGGSVLLGFISGRDSGASAIAVQADGKIVAAGFTHPEMPVLTNQSEFAIARFHPSGLPDASFGNGGRVVTNVATRDKVKDIVIQPDGKILVTGEALYRSGSMVYKGDSMFAVRYNSDGSTDTAFGTNGIAKLSFEQSSDPPVTGFQTAESLTLQADGKIIVVGTATVAGSGGFVGGAAIARFLPNGQADTSFDSDGKVFTILNNSQNTTVTFQIKAVANQPNGKVIVVGSIGSNNGSAANDFAIFRYLTDGTPDTSFDGDGKLVSSIEVGNDFARDVLIQPNGKIIVAGESSGNSQNFAVARYNDDGSFDISFDNDGKAITDFGTNTADFISQAALQTDGKIVAAGISGSNLALARYIGGTLNLSRPLFDYDGDGRADISVFRPSENRWYILRSGDNQITQQFFAIAGDVPVPADFDGDGKTDMSIFRPSSGDWWSLSSINNAQIFAHWGVLGDIPRPSDFDGDGRADYIVFRAAENNWYRVSSATGISSTRLFGATGDKPITGDFDGDGKSDVAIYRPSTGDWWWQSSVDNIQRAVRWGISSDVPAPADFDGDGRTDFAVYRPSTGVWYVINSSNGSFTITAFGNAEDKPVAADYDGDGRADIAVFRPSTGIWYLLRSMAGFTALQFGISSDIPTENSFVP